MVVEAAQLLSIQVGKVEHFPESESTYLPHKTWSSAINKRPIDGDITLTTSGLTGDEQADPRYHGGCDKAICVYPSEHYAYWKSALDLTLTSGGFGENFTTVQLLEKDVCIGDIYQIGEAQLQVTQPRQPCWKLSKRYDLKELALLVQETGKSGWYFSVLQPGTIQPASTITRIHRSSSLWTIDAANTLMHHDKANYPAIEQLLAECPTLATSWRKTFTSRLQKRHTENTEPRLKPM